MESEPLPTVYSLAASDPDSELVERSAVDPESLEQIEKIMAQMGRLRAVERKISRSSQRYMKLNETDMRALRLLIAGKHRGDLVTPGQIAKHVNVSTASVTKMLDRLEAGGHITRRPHPNDRRSQCVEITPETHLAAREQVGRHHAVRFEAARRLTPAEREVVIRFLAESADDLEASLEGRTP
ncbi:MarR family transcriptional regulator [Glutamicibacter sp. MNS18]|uniref:MarR family winged helix-turn-helix transcriptional regulator n=1 Tax=Glutamicibacter sp. MNS18 TaxID=2989817 RepID=UPI002236093A|nr:MarR family transcriptional regulator [Glutamicibacter sp. MNS18]MCW4466106.1 MarR family transcriptional regulator [Glutamicibacter sp. MNS18]